MPYKTAIFGGLGPGKNISIQGVVNPQASRSDVSLLLLLCIIRAYRYIVLSARETNLFSCFKYSVSIHVISLYILQGQTLIVSQAELPTANSSLGSQFYAKCF